MARFLKIKLYIVRMYNLYLLKDQRTPDIQAYNLEIGITQTECALFYFC